jgi:DNA repair protein RadC
MANVGHLEQERFVAAYLNARNVVSARETLGVGSLDASYIRTPSVLPGGVRHNVAAIIHPAPPRHRPRM